MLVKFGAETAIDEINAAGGIKTLGGAKLELVAIDAGDSAEKAKNAAQRLVAQEPDVVDGMGAWLSTFTLAVTEVTERADPARGAARCFHNVGMQVVGGPLRMKETHEPRQRSPHPQIRRSGRASLRGS
jgi:hypothetical protein